MFQWIKIENLHSENHNMTTLQKPNPKKPLQISYRITKKQGETLEKIGDRCGQNSIHDTARMMMIEGIVDFSSNHKIKIGDNP